MDAATAVDSENVIVDGHRIHYLTAGDGDRTLVLLHGGIIDSASVSWRAHIEPLAESATVIVPDLLGYGRSEGPDEPVGLDRHVTAVSQFLATLGLDAPTVAGVSLGGGIGMGLALRHPDRLANLVAVSPYGLGRALSNGLLTWVLARVQVTNRLSVALMRRSRRYVRFGLEQLVADDDSLTDAFVDRVIEEVRRPGAGRGFRRFRAAEVTRRGYRTTYVDRLDELAVPVHLVHGIDDDVFPAAWSRRAADRMPDAELTLLEPCGHLVPIEYPDRTRAVIRSAL